MGEARVLICEDEGLTALRLKTSLTQLGYEVVGEARDGEEAVTAAARLNPDAILMDLRMPKLDGIAATERIMGACPTAIVMITAYSERELVEAALQAGASGYLVKPVSDEQIEPALAVALAKFAQLRERTGEVNTDEANGDDQPKGRRLRHRIPLRDERHEESQDERAGYIDDKGAPRERRTPLGLYPAAEAVAGFAPRNPPRPTYQACWRPSHAILLSPSIPRLASFSTEEADRDSYRFS
jgi:AmiR/NasT family two-component response regulator